VEDTSVRTALFADRQFSTQQSGVQLRDSDSDVLVCMTHHKTFAHLQMHQAANLELNASSSKEVHVTAN
jgi:hypothetical protein